MALKWTASCRLRASARAKQLYFNKFYICNKIQITGYNLLAYLLCDVYQGEKRVAGTLSGSERVHSEPCRGRELDFIKKVLAGARRGLYQQLARAAVESGTDLKTISKATVDKLLLPSVEVLFHVQHTTRPSRCKKKRRREKSLRIGKTAICHPFVNPTSFGKDVVSFIWTQSEVSPLWAPLLQAIGHRTRGDVLDLHLNFQVALNFYR